MNEPTPAHGARGKIRHVAVQFCCATKVGHLTPYREWHNELQLTEVPELPAPFGEFIEADDEDPALGPEVLLREDELPLPDGEICRIGPPLPVERCDAAGQGCPTHE